MASGTLERCSLQGWIPVFTVQGRWQTACMAFCGWAVCWYQCCGSSGPWWRWGYGVGRCMLWTKNPVAFYWWHFECTEILWQDLEAHCCVIPPRLSPHVAYDNARPHVARICTKKSQFLYGQHTHRTCHPLSMFGMLWIGVYDSVFQFLPISSNFAQPLKRSGATFHRPHSTTWSTLCKGDMLHCVRQMVVTPDTDWFSGPPPPNTVKLHILEWPFIVASLRHTCAIIILSNQHLVMLHLWGGWFISAKEKWSLTHI